jgi:hypothetical protein
MAECPKACETVGGRPPGIQRDENPLLLDGRILQDGIVGPAGPSSTTETAPWARLKRVSGRQSQRLDLQRLLADY